MMDFISQHSWYFCGVVVCFLSLLANFVWASDSEENAIEALKSTCSEVAISIALSLVWPVLCFFVVVFYLKCCFAIKNKRSENRQAKGDE